jgi:hypothetical protein
MRLWCSPMLGSFLSSPPAPAPAPATLATRLLSANSRLPISSRPSWICAEAPTSSWNARTSIFTVWPMWVTRAQQYAAIVTEPKRFKMYEAPHALNAEARRDRIAFLADQLQLEPPHRIRWPRSPTCPSHPTPCPSQVVSSALGPNTRQPSACNSRPMVCGGPARNHAAFRAGLPSRANSFSATPPPVASEGSSCDR